MPIQESLADPQDDIYICLMICLNKIRKLFLQPSTTSWWYIIKSSKRTRISRWVICLLCSLNDLGRKVEDERFCWSYRTLIHDITFINWDTRSSGKDSFKKYTRESWSRGTRATLHMISFSRSSSCVLIKPTYCLSWSWDDRDFGVKPLVYHPCAKLRALQVLCLLEPDAG